MNTTLAWGLLTGLLAGLCAGAALGWLAAIRARGTPWPAPPGQTLPGQALPGQAPGQVLGAQAVAEQAAAMANTAQVASLVGPLRESLSAVRDQLAEAERGRLESDIAVRVQVEQLRHSSAQLHEQTGQLITALRAPHIRGRWGEMQLRRVVEAAGMSEHIDFIEQASTDGPNGRLRPDMVVQLSNGRTVLVDSKVAFTAYLEANQASDEATRRARLSAHARALRTHVDQLAAKSYWAAYEHSPEFVVCFVPADTFLDAALAEDPHLLEHAFTHDVVLATPSTLVALLRTVAYTWRQRELAENAEQVHRLGKELHDRLVTFDGHLTKLGRALGGAVGAYNDAVGSLERRVLSKARQFQALGVVGPASALPRLSPLDDAVPHTRAGP